MDHEIQLFRNDEFGEVRTVLIDGEPWFVGKDVANILGYTNPLKAIRDHVFEEDKGMNEMFTPGGKQHITVINESGIYCLILSSSMPNARAFKHWVTSDILPAIRKTGMYAISDDAIIQQLAPNADMRTLAFMRSTLGTIHELSRQIEEDKPKIAFADQVADSNTLIDMNAMAKLAEHNGFPIGPNRLFRWLRYKRILMANNIPYQEYIERGYFEVREGTYTAHGERRLSYKTLVTGKGQIYIVTRLRKEYLDDIIPYEV